MKNISKIIFLNVLIIVSLVLSIWFKMFIIILSGLLLLNIILIYRKSNSFDKNEEKKKMMLHKIKGSLSVILGYSEAYNDELITKSELDKKINEEIQDIVLLIKDEIYTK